MCSDPVIKSTLVLPRESDGAMDLFQSHKNPRHLTNPLLHFLRSFGENTILGTLKDGGRVSRQSSGVWGAIVVILITLDPDT